MELNEEHLSVGFVRLGGALSIALNCRMSTNKEEQSLMPGALWHVHTRRHSLISGASIKGRE